MASASEPAALLVKTLLTGLGYAMRMKEEQLEIVVVFLSGSDVFAVLQTGFGKSLCYACMPAFCFRGD